MLDSFIDLFYLGLIIFLLHLSFCLFLHEKFPFCLLHHLIIMAYLFVDILHLFGVLLLLHFRELLLGFVLIGDGQAACL
jgi:hypothetical protein